MHVGRGNYSSIYGVLVHQPQLMALLAEYAAHANTHRGSLEEILGNRGPYMYLDSNLA